jgi:predicted DCC family thiol-disulfide oxidoreductase YuxK
MTALPVFPLQVFYDGSCAVCAVEMAHYRTGEHRGRLVFTDINGEEFDPAPFGISREAFMYELHAIDREGRVYRGVAAFRAIWQAFPHLFRYRLLVVLVGLPGVALLARCTYRIFARFRRYLPKAGHLCRDGTCTGPRT